MVERNPVKDRMRQLSIDRAFLENIETVHGVKLTKEGKEGVKKKIAEIEKEWNQLQQVHTIGFWIKKNIELARKNTDYEKYEGRSKDRKG